MLGINPLALPILEGGLEPITLKADGGLDSLFPDSSSLSIANFPI